MASAATKVPIANVDFMLFSVDAVIPVRGDPVNGLTIICGNLWITV
jgi:hypothetical protein